MLTADLVHARTHNGVLKVVPLDPQRRPRAIALAKSLIDAAADAAKTPGTTRETFDAALDDVVAPAADRKLADALRKLLEDRCTFEGPSEDDDPPALRRALFSAAAKARRDADGRHPFDAQAFVTVAAERLGRSPDDLMRALFADLKEAQRLTAFDRVSPDALVDGLPIAQAQAVLLRAVKVLAEVRCPNAAAYRALFRKLKFLRLLPSITPITGGGYAIEIDGPLSLFEATTKYGLCLALALPSLMECDHWSITADVRWGKARSALRFSMTGQGVGARVTERLPDDVEALRAAITRLDGPWKAEASSTILSLPGLGTLVPDLVCTHRVTGARVLIEVLGFWSRDAVWKRVELAEHGLPEPVLFAASSRLRVSEEVLDERASGALYVYKGTMSPRAVVERLDRLAQGASPSRRASKRRT